MKTLSDVLEQKEAELQKLQREVEALRVAVNLCGENSGTNAPPAESDVRIGSSPAAKPPRSVSPNQPEKVMKRFP